MTKLPFRVPVEDSAASAATAAPVQSQHSSMSATGSSATQQQHSDRTGAGRGEESFESSRLATSIVFLCALIIGGALTFAGLAIEAPGAATLKLVALFLGALGTTVLISGGLSVIYDWILRRRLINDNAKIMASVVDDALTRIVRTEMGPEINSAISRNMPAKYRNLAKAGVDDAFSSLHVGRWKDKIRKLSGTHIRILKMYIPDITEIEDVLFEAIQSRRCSAQVLLLNPESDEVLEKRAACLHDMDAAAIKDRINSNIRRITSIWKRLDSSRRHALELRLHSSFVAASLHGQGDEFTMGLYLRGRTATQGVQLRVRGAGKELFQHLSYHFAEEWEAARVYDFPSGTLHPLAPVQEQRRQLED